jgi:AAA+ ATPase superfamily predicted ATPase
MAKFYNREQERAKLQKATAISEKRGIFTLVIGRRRVGKTTLLLNSFDPKTTLYLFVSKKSEGLLVEEFMSQLKELVSVPLIGRIQTFEEFLKILFQVTREQPLTVIFDEFQDFSKVNSTIFSTLQKLWDLNKNDSHIHLIACGSIYSMMNSIFEGAKEALFGRADFKIHVTPFQPSVLKEVLNDNNQYSARNLFDFYVFTGGIAKYIDLFSIRNAFSKDELIEEFFSSGSIFIDEGKNCLFEEFGPNYSTYFSLLSLIASGKTARREMESIIEKNVSQYLDRLENDFSIIQSIKPFGAKPNSKTQKYEIIDPFLTFWFRFVYTYQSYVESESFSQLKTIVYRDYDSFAGVQLEQLYREIFKETGRFISIGRYWERGNKNEIDIVALDEQNKELWLCEVKTNADKLSLDELIHKSKKLTSQFSDYSPVYKLLSVDSIDEFMEGIA